MGRYWLFVLVTTIVWTLSSDPAAQVEEEIAGAEVVRAKAAEVGVVRVIARLSPKAVPPASP